ncbi:hypothetical protein VTO42DRAFT_6630 [Malbranchea cinnamomea]
MTLGFFRIKLPLLFFSFPNLLGPICWVSFFGLLKVRGADFRPASGTRQKKFQPRAVYYLQIPNPGLFSISIPPYGRRHRPFPLN